MEDVALQTIEGAGLAGGLLAELADVFFKGLDKALTDQAEYEEEMGVLKQVNRITIEDVNTGNQYLLTIKLAPVRGKDGYYYVEASSNAPGLKLDNINGTVMQFDKTSIAKFREKIDKMLEKNGLAPEDNSDNSDENNTEEQEQNDGQDNLSEQSEEDDSEETQLNTQDEMEALIDAALDWFDETAAVASTADDQLVQLHFDFADEIIDGQCELLVSVTDDTDRKVKNFKLPEDMKISLLDDSGNVVDKRTFLMAVNDKMIEFADLNRYNHLQHAIENYSRSQVASATFIRDNEGVGLVAIKASSDLDKTMDMIYDVMDSDEFVNSLEEGSEASFSIQEIEDDYDIEPIDDVDCTQCYVDIYKTVSKLYITLKLVQSMVGVKIWRSDNFFNNLTIAATMLQTKVSIWALNESDILPLLQDPFAMIPTFEKFRNYSDNSEIPQIKQNLAELVHKTTEMCSFLSAGINEEHCVEIEKCCNRLDNIADSAN